MQVADLALCQQAPMQDMESQLPLAVLGSMEVLRKAHGLQTFSSR